MKRSLDKRFAWNPENTALELLDWENRPADFEILYHHIVAKLNAWLNTWSKGKYKAVEEIVKAEELRREVKRCAGQFREKFVSLPMCVYLKLKVYLVNKIQDE